MTDNLKRILIVDDEEDLCEILQFNLESEGYEIETAFSAEEALEKELDTFDLLLLDVMMGKMSGFKLAEKIRKQLKIKVPVMFLTAKDTENDILTGFNLGADDYLAKPFSIKELIARVKAVIRRSALVMETESPKIIEVEDMELDLEKKRLTLVNERIDLTRKEFDILKLFLENQARVFSREDILSKIWSNDVIVTERTVDVNITRLRKKIGKYGKCLKNRPGYGYYFEVL
ncbi:response regulator transcription factor [Prolixibacteraceae bacterium JC049]|nr:response regulator transcription factor [Prolixibacteraceae bacterium JC049]